MIHFPVILLCLSPITYIEVFKNPLQFLVILSSIICPIIPVPLQMLPPSFRILVFWCVALCLSSSVVELNLICNFLLCTLLLSFCRQQSCRQCPTQSHYQGMFLSYSIYSIAKSNDFLQHNLHTCQESTGNLLLGHIRVVCLKVSCPSSSSVTGHGTGYWRDQHPS
jgi:hypothetical protein